MTTIYEWSTDPSQNATVDALVRYPADMKPGEVIPTGRAFMARVKEYIEDKSLLHTLDSSEDGNYAIKITSDINKWSPSLSFYVMFNSLPEKPTLITFQVGNIDRKYVLVSKTKWVDSENKFSNVYEKLSTEDIKTNVVYQIHADLDNSLGESYRIAAHINQNRVWKASQPYATITYVLTPKDKITIYQSGTFPFSREELVFTSPIRLDNRNIYPQLTIQGPWDGYFILDGDKGYKIVKRDKSKLIGNAKYTLYIKEF